MVPVKVYHQDGSIELGFTKEYNIEESHFDVFFPFTCKVTNIYLNPLQGSLDRNAYLQDVDYDKVEFV